MLFDPVAKGGILFEKIRYQYRKKCATKRRIAENNDNDDDDEEISDEELDEKVSELVDYFGSVWLPRDRSQLLSKLEESAKIRLIAIRQGKTEAFESSRKLYLIDPDLVNVHTYILCLWIQCAYLMYSK